MKTPKECRNISADYREIAVRLLEKKDPVGAQEADRFSELWEQHADLYEYVQRCLTERPCDQDTPGKNGGTLRD